MEHARFDALTRGLAHGLTRRGAIAGLTALTGAALAIDDAEGKKKKKKKVTVCRNKQTIKVTKKKKQKHLQPGDTEGPCPPPSPPPGPPPGPPPPPPPPPPACPDVNPGDDLQAAINAAEPGSTLRLCPGTFLVTSTLSVEKDLTIVGAGMEETILDGGDTVSVLIVGGNRTVKVENLTITRGNAGENVDGGGIINNGDLTLRRMAVTFCKALTGGGIMNFQGTLTLNAGSVVENNTAGTDGGGIMNFQGTITMNEGSRVSTNTAQENGGGILTFGALTLNAGSFVVGNTATDGKGGGILHISGLITLNPGSVVEDNEPDNCESDLGACQ